MRLVCFPADGGKMGCVTRSTPLPPLAHESGLKPPPFTAAEIPQHVAIVMDGNGRWAHQRGLKRTAGHEAGEGALFDVVHGALELGIKWLSVYAFSTENWKRSPEEVSFLMGFNRRVVARRRQEMYEHGIKVRWVGRPKMLWRSVIKELQETERLTANNDTMNLVMCINYGGRAEIADACMRIAEDSKSGALRPKDIDEDVVARYLYDPEIPDVDLFIRSSGEQRTSNFLLWQSAYAEMVFLDTLWPDFDRRHLWHAIDLYRRRDRRYGAAPPVEPPGRFDTPSVSSSSQLAAQGSAAAAGTAWPHDASAPESHGADSR